MISSRSKKMHLKAVVLENHEEVLNDWLRKMDSGPYEFAVYQPVPNGELMTVLYFTEEPFEQPNTVPVNTNNPKRRR
jgi:hypothetical protein